MRKAVWVLALALMVSIPAVSFAADASCAQPAQQETFLQSLAQPAQAPAPPALAEAPVQAVPAGACINLHCGQDSDCWPHCGGMYGSYCSATNRCMPY